MPNPKKKPKEQKEKSKRQILAGREPLKVSELRNLISRKDPCDLAYQQAIDEWGIYFQSPVDKVTATKEGLFKFNKRGGFQCTDLAKANDDAVTNFEKTLKTLFPNLEPRDTALEDWLRSGKPLSAEKVELVRRRLFAKSAKLTNELLFDQPICRLVHRSQLRLDLDYQVPYQLTPGQIRLLTAEEDPNNRTDLEFLRRNQRWYWGLSETFQSLIALFDSDLGSTADAKGPRQFMTKEFIRLHCEEESAEKDLAPHQLNKSSPLRFWAPPPAFAGSVFHMLFWRAVITGQDLFGRYVINNGDADTPKNRAEQYYVLVNWFNAAKFRLADYERLFEALMAIARMVASRYPTTTCLSDIKEPLKLDDEPEGLLYPSYFANSKVRFPRFQEIDLVLPFNSVRTKVWELAWEHQQGIEETNKPTTIGDLLIFLRDKALEIIIWSRYQMEIRSVGMIPIQHLYRVELRDHSLEKIDKLAELWNSADDDPLLQAEAAVKINEVMQEAIFKEEVDEWVWLHKVYGGTYRQINDRSAWNKIKRLRSPRVGATNGVQNEIKDENASEHGCEDKPETSYGRDVSESA
jgi:hypothetical protein